MKTVSERYDVFTPFHQASQFQCSFNSIGTGGACELQFIVHASRLQKDALECFHEMLLGIGGHVQAVNNAVAMDILKQLFLQLRVVVPVIQRTGTCEEVEILATCLVKQGGTLSLAENNREGTNVAANFRLHPIKNIQVHDLIPLVKIKI